MTIYQRKVLYRDHEGCSASIPVPSPFRIGPLGDPPSNAAEINPAIFLCTECGLASLYHITDYGREQALNAETADPFERGVFRLGYIYAECTGEACKHPFKVYVVFDRDKAIVCKQPVSKWRIDREITCPNGHNAQFTVGEEFQVYVTQMPF